MPDPIIIYIDKKDRDRIQKIIESKFFDFGESTNIEMFLIAMSIGFESGNTLPLESKDTYIRVEYLQDKDKAFIYSCAISHFNDVEVLNDKRKIFDFAQECAHYGFVSLENLISHGSIEVIQNNFVHQIIDKYKSYNS